MHRCLSIDEILTTICQHAFNILKPEPKSRELRDRRTLARLARTSRYFLEPALNVLYYEINDLLWLIKCMPDDLWVVNGKQLSFKRPMEQSDWDVFLRYTRRVRSLEFDRHCTTTTHVNVYHSLATYPYPDVMFPRLTHLRCGEWREDAVWFLRHLLQPTVNHIDIDNLLPNALTYRVLPLIPKRCPRVRQLMAFRNLVFQQGDPVLDQFSNLLCQLNLLESVRCAELTDESLLHLARLPALKILRVDLRLNPLHNLDSSLRGRGFPVLREALVSSPTMSHCLQFLKYVKSTSLDTINLNVDDETPAASYKEIFTAWGLNPSYQNLSTIDISEMRVWRDYDEKHIIDITVLRPLFQLKGLTCLKLETLCTYDLDDAAIKEIATAWPLLETLDLSLRECGWEIPSKVTLQGLIPLLRGCPNLALLGVVVDATRLPAASTRLPGAGVRNTSLESLWLADSKITRPSLVAAFLSAVAPNIEQIVTWNTPLLSGREGKDKYRKRWREVEGLVRMFSITRRQEHAWARDGNVGCDEEEEAQAWSSEPDLSPDSDSDSGFEYCYPPPGVL
ncbi:hypothetical protein HYDPIDRAFT_34429 [Hydnomerulius pinastri MD-312]|uniref:F-box domain-containing protein n=1 Tax=Hydnomerulius pinastri MD-312 TaxID=994086 RepID=A0A0C9VXY8_9AGAM|nr:hypothetical protein HYDPIDRAFT_34429 [Hydnomerulius pinastri MD-312]